MKYRYDGKFIRFEDLIVEAGTPDEYIIKLEKYRESMIIETSSISKYVHMIEEELEAKLNLPEFENAKESSYIRRIETWNCNYFKERRLKRNRGMRSIDERFIELERSTKHLLSKQKEYDVNEKLRIESNERLENLVHDTKYLVNNMLHMMSKNE